MDFPDSKIEVIMKGSYKIARMIRKVKPDIVITDREDGGNGHRYHINTHKLVIDALTYCRLKDPDTDLPPHRKPMNVFTETSLEKKSRYETIFVDVLDQYQKIMEFINIYKEAYNFPDMDKLNNHLLIHQGLRNGNARYAEAFKILKGILSPYSTQPTNPGFSSF